MFSRQPIWDDKWSLATQAESITVDLVMVDCMYDELQSYPSIVACFLNLPDGGAPPIALDFVFLSQAQLQDPELLQRHLQYPLNFPTQHFQGIELITHQTVPDQSWKICIPTQHLRAFVHWYHEALTHCGVQ